MKSSGFSIGRCALIFSLLLIAGCHHARIQGPVSANAPSNSVVLPGNLDSIALISVNSAPGDALERGKPEDMIVGIVYTLAARDHAILRLVLDQFPSRDSCASPTGNTSAPAFLTPAEKEVEITRGTHTLEIPITWPGDTGVGTDGHIFGAGTLSFHASMRTDFHYEFLTRRFGTEYCMRF